VAALARAASVQAQANEQLVAVAVRVEGWR